MPTVGKDNVPVMYLEIVEQGNSGFYLDNTKGTQHEHQLRTPTVSWIPTEGIAVDIVDGVKRNRRIRHIKGCEKLDPKEQELQGFTPNRNNDKIPFDNGFATIKREGATVGTYDYLLSATYFVDNPNRPDSATPLYREIKVDERAVELVDEDELLTVAKSKVYALRMNTGGKDKPYKYDVDKINTYCQLLNVFDETPERQLVQLLNKAVTNPKSFLDIVVQAEQTVIIEVTHALQLGVIMFDKNVAQYTEESKVITPVGTGNMSETKKIEALAAYLQTAEASNDLTELRTKLEIAKEKQFSK